MTVKTLSISLETRGNAEIQDITQVVRDKIAQSGLRDGVVTLFTPSSTSGFTTIEYEAGCVSDLQRLFDEIADPDRYYEHEARWHDGNGHSHVRAALLGASLSVPFVDGRLTVGTWQQIVFIDFDIRPRRRELVVQVMGE